MGAFTQDLILRLDRFFADSNDYFDALTRSPDEAFEYSIRSGRVVLDQFHGFNDLRGRTLLDYGCGGGGKTVHYARQGAARVIGVDLHCDAPRARAFGAREGLSLEFYSLEPDGRIPLPAASIDVILSSSVLEHVGNLPRALAELRRVLRPGGLALHRWHPFATRRGAHLGATLGLPFAHRLFPEADLVQAYYRSLIDKYGRVPDCVRPPVRAESAMGTSPRRIPTLDELDLPLNRVSIAALHRHLRHSGHKILERRYLRGTRELPWASRIPPRWREWVCDYEVVICTPA